MKPCAAQFFFLERPSTVGVARFRPVRDAPPRVREEHLGKCSSIGTCGFEKIAGAWFFTPEEQRDWERQYSKPAGDIPRTEGEANP
jgi:hypothetical protein